MGPNGLKRVQTYLLGNSSMTELDTSANIILYHASFLVFRWTLPY